MNAEKRDGALTLGFGAAGLLVVVAGSIIMGRSWLTPESTPFRAHAAYLLIGTLLTWLSSAALGTVALAVGLRENPFGKNAMPTRTIGVLLGILTLFCGIPLALLALVFLVGSRGRIGV